MLVNMVCVLWFDVGVCAGCDELFHLYPILCCI